MTLPSFAIPDPEIPAPNKIPDFAEESIPAFASVGGVKTSGVPDFAEEGTEVPFFEQVKYEWDNDPNNFYTNAQDWMSQHAPGVVLKYSDKISEAIQDISSTASFGLTEKAKEQAPFVTSRLSLGLISETLADKYGEDFYDLTPDQRKQRIGEYKLQQLQQLHPDTNPEDITTGASIAGQLAATVKDPLTFLPFGQVGKAKTLVDMFKKVGPAAAGVTAASEAMRQAARENEFDLIQVGEAGAIGFVLTPLIAFGGTKAAGLITRKLGQSAERKLAEQSSELVDKVQQQVIEEVAKGKPRFQALQDTLTSLDIKMQDFNTAMTRTGTKTNGLFIPGSQKAAIEILEDATPIGMRPWKSGSFVDDALEPIISRIKKIDEKVWLDTVRLEKNVHKRPYDLSIEANKLVKSVKGLSKENQKLFQDSWLSRDVNTIKRIFHNNPEALENFKGVRKTLDSLHAEYKHYVNKDIPYLTDYLPRMVKSITKLREALDYTKKSGLDTALLDASGKKGSALTDLEKLDITGKWLRGYPREPARSGFTKGRKFGDIVPEEARPHYAGFEESFHAYVRRAVYDIEKAKFFGKSLKYNKELQSIDLEGTVTKFVLEDRSIGSKSGLSPAKEAGLVVGIRTGGKIIKGKPGELHFQLLDRLAAELPDSAQFGGGAGFVDKTGKFYTRDEAKATFGVTEAKDLTNRPLVKDAAKLDELRRLLTARFGIGEMAPNKIVSMFRNIGYAAFLGHPTSAATQLQDIVFTAVREGIIPTFQSLIRKDITTAAKQGLKQATEELAESSAFSARALEKNLKLIQFERIDQLGKTTNLNATLIKYTNLVKTDKGLAKFSKQYANAYDDDFAKLVDDLQHSRITDDVDTLAWAELLEIQPVSKSSMPLKYLENPNGRLFYMLSSFTLTQLDYARRNIFRQLAAGNIVEGTSQLVKFGTLLTIAGVSRVYLINWMLGRDTSNLDIPDEAVVAFWKNFAASELTVRKILEADKPSKVGEAVLGSVTIPIPILDLVSTVGQDIFKYLDNEEDYGLTTDKQKTYRSQQYIPVVGKFLYEFFGGGREKRQAQLDKKQKKSYGL